MTPKPKTAATVDVDVDDLKRLAEAATQGAWTCNSPFDVHCDGCGDVVCDAYDIESDDEHQTAYIQVCGMQSFAEPNARYIAAANPQAILELLAERKRLRSLLAEARCMCSHEHFRTPCSWCKRREDTLRSTPDAEEQS